MMTAQEFMDNFVTELSQNTNWRNRSYTSGTALYLSDVGKVLGYHATAKYITTENKGHPCELSATAERVFPLSRKSVFLEIESPSVIEPGNLYFLYDLTVTQYGSMVIRSSDLATVEFVQSDSRKLETILGIKPGNEMKQALDRLVNFRKLQKYWIR